MIYDLSISVYVYTCKHAHEPTHAHTHTYISKHLHSQAYTHIHTPTVLHVYVCMFIKNVKL